MPKKKEPQPKTSFADWQANCVRVSEDLGLAVSDMWDEGDPYELQEVAREAYEGGQGELSFIEEIFDEDLARQEGDDADYEASLEAAFEEDCDE